MYWKLSFFTLISNAGILCWFFYQFFSVLPLHIIICIPYRYVSFQTIIHFQNSHFFSLEWNIFSVCSFSYSHKSSIDSRYWSIDKMLLDRSAILLIESPTVHFLNGYYQFDAFFYRDSIQYKQYHVLYW